MQKLSLFASTLIALLLFSFITPASAIPPKAFPTAEGYGTQTVGGRGGVICEVTNLDDSGVGSLRNCVEGITGARTVVFKTGGTISLANDIIINAAHSYITIAGQTAPGDGIQIKNWGFYIQDGAHDVVIRYLRIRPGSDACIAKGLNSCDYNSGVEMWGVDIPNRVYNVVLDHLSIQWSVDQNATVWDSVSDVTIQNCIIASGATSGHSKGSHSMGFLAGGDIGVDTVHPRSISIHHTVFAHNQERNPRVDDPSIFDFRNNVIYYYPTYNSGNIRMQKATNLYPVNFNTTQANFVNNVYKKNPLDLGDAGSYNTILDVDSQTRIYITGNYSPLYPTGTVNDFNPGNIYGGNSGINLLSSPVTTPFVTTYSTSLVLTNVLPSAGAKLPTRDIIDSRIMDDIINGTGTVGQDQNNWPTLAVGTASVDTDHDGMPDDWETTHSLNPNNSSDRNSDANNNGYTAVEEYLNELAGDPAVSSGTLVNNRVRRRKR
jgi:hypothetical protein